MMFYHRHWVGYYVNNYLHMGNRTTNRAKYRDSQTVREALFERVVKDGVSTEIDDKMSNLRERVTSYAFDHIRDELIQMKKNDTLESGHELNSNITSEKCAFISRRAFRLPCRHVLQKQNGQIRLASVHKRWYICYRNGRVATISEIAETNAGDESENNSSILLEVQLHQLHSLTKGLKTQQEKNTKCKQYQCLKRRNYQVGIPIPKGLTKKQVVGHFNPLPDGNCGFRALSHAILGDQEQYQLLKSKLIAFINEKNAFYRQIWGSSTSSEPSPGTFESILNKLCNEASLSTQGNWFQFPEMLAIRLTSKTLHSLLYFSCPSPTRPILLQLHASHFYLIEIKATSRPRWPPTFPGHSTICINNLLQDCTLLYTP
ncbi:hypothetical protein V8B55DRAFT_1556675, partial [Mucor lusitanicus]